MLMLSWDFRHSLAHSQSQSPPNESIHQDVFTGKRLVEVARRKGSTVIWLPLRPAPSSRSGGSCISATRRHRRSAKRRQAPHGEQLHKQQEKCSITEQKRHFLPWISSPCATTWHFASCDTEEEAHTNHLFIFLSAILWSSAPWPNDANDRHWSTVAAASAAVEDRITTTTLSSLFRATCRLLFQCDVLAFVCSQLVWNSVLMNNSLHQDSSSTAAAGKEENEEQKHLVPFSYWFSWCLWNCHSSLCR